MITESDMEFKDLRISPKQFLSIVESVYSESDLGDINKTGHPTDVYYAISTIVDNLGRGLGYYIDEVVKNSK